MSKDEAIERLTDMTDRYPMDVGQDGMAPMVMKRNVANLYDYLSGTWAPLEPAAVLCSSRQNTDHQPNAKENTMPRLKPITSKEQVPPGTVRSPMQS
jgi:hypothetical protein